MLKSNSLFLAFLLSSFLCSHRRVYRVIVDGSVYIGDEEENPFDEKITINDE